MAPLLRIGLTGGIASGKSTVSALFARRGIPVLDTDRIAPRSSSLGCPALQQIIDAFGDGILDAEGRLDRQGLRSRIFANATARRTLEAIMHPAIRADARQSSDAGGPYQIWVIPLLVEGGRVNTVDRILVVDCPVETQLARLQDRDGETAESAGA